MNTINIHDSPQSLTLSNEYKLDGDILYADHDPFSRSNILNIPPKRMWGWGAKSPGFCGEQCFQSAGLYFGQYVSQEIVHRAAGNKELLIGVNDVRAAKALNLLYEQYEGDSTPESMMEFYQANIRARNFCIGTAFIFQDRGDSDYDHIIPIVGYTDDFIVYQDLDIPENRILKSPFVTRREASRKRAAPGKLLTYGLSAEGYAGVVKGIRDTKHETFRMMLQTNMTEESPSRRASLIKFSAVIMDLSPGTSYTILRYDDRVSVPSQNFLQTKTYTKAIKFTAPYINCFLPDFDTGISNGSYFYRVVASGKSS